MSKKFIRVVRTLVLLFSVIIFLVRPVFAISNGVEDVNNDYPNVGAIVYHWNADPLQTKFLACSGVLIGSDVFLTAGHCPPPPEIAPYITLFVTFDEQFEQSSDFIEVSDVHVHPKFGHDMGDLYDIAVMLLVKNAGIEPADLPEVGSLDEESKKGGLIGTDIVNVGYGVVPEWKEGPPRWDPPDGWRRISTSPFIALTKSRLVVLMNNDATGDGGVCYGDSGGPHFLDGQLVALTSGGDNVCRALSYNYRLDTQSVMDFLGPFLSP